MNAFDDRSIDDVSSIPRIPPQFIQPVIAQRVSLANYRLNSIALAITLLLAGAGKAWAVCPADGGGIFRVTTGETCTAAGTSYSGASNSNSILRASGAGSVINITAPSATVSNVASGNGWGLTTDAGGTINALGDLTAVTNGFNGRSIFLPGGALNVLGNLRTNHLVRAQGSAIELGGAVMDVAGTTTIRTAAADGIRNGGTARFRGDVDMVVNNYLAGIRNTGTTLFDGNLSITSNNMIVGINMIGGTISVGRNMVLAAQVSGGNNGLGITQSNGLISIGGNATVSTVKNAAAAITIGGGRFEALGSASSISASGATSDGVSMTGGVVALGSAAAGAPAGTAAVLVDAGSVTSSSGDGIDITTTASDLLARVGAAGSVTGGLSGIRATQNGAGNTSVSAAGLVSGGSEAGITTVASTGNSVTIDLLNGASISSVAGVAVRDANANASLSMASGSRASGLILLGNGNDTATIRGTADLSGVTLLDAGDSTDAAVTDVLGTAGAATNRLNFQDATQSLGGSVMRNWQTVTLNNSAVVLNGDATLVTGSGTFGDGSLQGLVLQNNSTLNSVPALAITGDVSIDATSTLRHVVGGSITGNVTNAGLMFWSNLGQTLTVNGNYTGVPGSRLSLETFLAGDGSTTDRLLVTGNTTGTTALEIRAAPGSPGAQTVDGIMVIEVNGTSAPGSFTLGAPAQAGAYEYTLRQGGAVSGGQNWFLNSVYTGPDSETVSIFRPGVANYVAAQTANIEQGLLQLASFHQRLGSQRIEDDEGHQTWWRPYSGTQAATGATRFGYDSTTFGLQWGRDMRLRRSGDGITERTAITVDYSSAFTDADDRLRPPAGLASFAGTTHGRSLAVGATHTLRDDQGAYLDLVGQLAALRNHFKDSNGGASRQTGWRIGLSVEAGQVVQRWRDWSLEPQGQLMFLHTRYSGFNDAQGRIDGYETEALRGRLGLRWFTHEKLQSVDDIGYYGVANLLYDFMQARTVTIAATPVRERFGRSSAELGMGVQRSLKDGGHAYADIRYRHNLDKLSSRGFELNAGVRMPF